MAHPFPSLRRTTRALITAAFLWLLSCWAWTIHHLIVLSHPPITPLLTNNHNDLHGDRLTTAKGMRQLDQITANIRGAASSTGLRATDSPAATLSHAAIDDPPPMTSLIFPLHARSGTHHVYMYIGSPPQRQTLIVDTGSRLTAFPCSPHCTECGMHASRQFDVNQSSSLSFVPCGECVLSRRDFELEAYFKGDGVGGNSGDGDVNVNLIPNGLRGTDGHKTEMKRKSCSKSHCEIHQRYTEGSSWNAFEVKDNVWLGFEDVNKSNLQHIEHSRPFVFGCQTSEEGLFQNQYADGIMGLSMYTQTLVGSLHEQGSVQHESFSLCFNSKGGHIALGGISSGNGLAQQNDHGIKHLSPMQFIPLARENTWYYTVHVTSISVGEHVLPSDTFQYLNDHKGTIVDSGTTDTFLSHKIAKVRNEKRPDIKFSRSSCSFIPFIFM